MKQDLFSPASPFHAATASASILEGNHYLGPTKRGVAYFDEAGVIVVASPTGRNLPSDWLELTRWCITDRTKNAGSKVTTIVSYSDPSVGHDGALYRACNWWWAPTWHRLRPPPSGNGSWTAGKREAVKDRWVFALRADERRVGVLVARDESVLRRYPWARYKEPGGADYKTFRALA